MHPCKLKSVAGALLVSGLLAAGTAHARGNVIFLHADGAALNHWTAARIYWHGPDGTLNWDRLPQMAAYRGHMTDLLTGTSNGGATAHAFGFNVEGLRSFGRDGARPIRALSGYRGSLLREAANNGHPVGLVNDGHIGEPGTGAFAAEVDHRDDWNAIALQLIAGRDGATPAKNSADRAPQVILGGGERNFLPAGTPTCAPETAGTWRQHGIATYPLDCLVHTLDWSRPGGSAGPLGIGRVASAERADHRNLLLEAAEAGYLVIRTRAEFEAVRKRIETDLLWRPRILGLFAAHHTFNDRTEEELIANGFRGAGRDAHGKRSSLVLFGNPRPTDPGFDPPRGDEMMRMALIVLGRAGDALGLPYLLVAEAESIDNFGNGNNAIGTLVALKVADDMIGVALDAIDGRRRDHLASRFSTTVLTAADSDAGGMQIRAFPEPVANVSAVGVNPAAGQPGTSAPLDGLYGRGTQSFAAAPDRFGRVGHFAIAWAGTPDHSGAILARAASTRPGDPRAEGKRAPLTLHDFSERFDNADVYRFLYAKLFGRLLPAPTGRAPAR